MDYESPARVGLKAALAAYEAGPTGHILAKTLEGNGLPVMELAPPNCSGRSVPGPRLIVVKGIGRPGRVKKRTEGNAQPLKFFPQKVARIDEKELKRLAGLKRHRDKFSALKTIPGVDP